MKTVPVLLFWDFWSTSNKHDQCTWLITCSFLYHDYVTCRTSSHILIVCCCAVNRASGKKWGQVTFSSLLPYRGFSRDVTRSRVCLVTLLIRHFGGQASAAVCAVCALQCVVYTAYQPSCSWRGVSVDVIKRHDFQTRLPWNLSSIKSVGRVYL